MLGYVYAEMEFGNRENDRIVAELAKIYPIQGIVFRLSFANIAID